MKMMHALLAAGVAIALGGTAFAAGTAPVNTASPADAHSRIIWTVVNVNKAGQVTGIQPSERLPGWEHDLLMKQLHAWFNQPARNKNGKPIASRFVMKLNMDAKPTPTGAYAANFTIAKTMPVNFAGSVYWNMSEPGDQLTLVSSSARIVYGNLNEISVDNAADTAPILGRNPTPPPPPPPPTSSGHH